MTQTLLEEATLARLLSCWHDRITPVVRCGTRVVLVAHGNSLRALVDAYRDHGEPKASLEKDVERAGWVLERLAELGIRIDKLTQQLEDEGVERFHKSFDKLMETLKERP